REAPRPPESQQARRPRSGSAPDPPRRSGRGQGQSTTCGRPGLALAPRDPDHRRPTTSGASYRGTKLGIDARESGADRTERAAGELPTAEPDPGHAGEGSANDPFERDW